MSAFVVWLDHEHAKVFKLLPGKVETQTLDERKARHHTSGEVSDRHNHSQLFQALTDKLTGASEVLLVGPGLAKSHFKTHLETHHHRDLAQKVVGIETVDHPTDGEILAKARKFFKVHDLY